MGAIVPSVILRAPKVLLTGFEPFGGEKLNASAEVVRVLDGRRIGGCTVQGVMLPCVFGRAKAELVQAIRLVNPRLVICLGQAAGRGEVTPERVAINVDDARIPDNAGAQPVDLPVRKGGPAAYWTGLPIKAIVASLQRRGIPASVSQTAGTFVCNHVFYGLMQALRRRAGVRGGFIHLPVLPEQAMGTQPSLPLETLVEAVSLAVATSLRVRRDIKATNGRLH